MSEQRGREAVDAREVVRTADASQPGFRDVLTAVDVPMTSEPLSLTFASGGGHGTPHAPDAKPAAKKSGNTVGGTVRWIFKSWEENFYEDARYMIRGQFKRTGDAFHDHKYFKGIVHALWIPFHILISIPIAAISSTFVHPFVYAYRRVTSGGKKK